MFRFGNCRAGETVEFGRREGMTLGRIGEMETNVSTDRAILNILRQHSENDIRERNVFICNSTSWITTIQSAKYKIQDKSNRHISYIMYKTSINRATTTRSSHEIA